MIDATDISFDINLDKKYYTEEEMERKRFKFGYPSSKGSYIRGKLTIAIDYDTFTQF